jgi:hypothetical protein
MQVATDALPIALEVAQIAASRLSPLPESGWIAVNQTLIGNVARITLAATRNVIATPSKIH